VGNVSRLRDGQGGAHWLRWIVPSVGPVMAMHLPPHPGEFIPAIYLEPFDEDGNAFTE